MFTNYFLLTLFFLLQECQESQKGSGETYGPQPRLLLISNLLLEQPGMDLDFKIWKRSSIQNCGYGYVINIVPNNSRALL